MYPHDDSVSARGDGIIVKLYLLSILQSLRTSQFTRSSSLKKLTNIIVAIDVCVSKHLIRTWMHASNEVLAKLVFESYGALHKLDIV